MKSLIKYHMGGEERYILHGNPITKEELAEIDRKNYEKGYRERMVGYYDKWYRYNTYDSGKAYDRGVMAAVESKQCVIDCTIIECIERQFA